MNNGIGTYYYASFEDTPCGHAHRTFEAAEKCALDTIRAARRGVKFGFPISSERIANETDEYAVGYVRSKTFSK